MSFRGRRKASRWIKRVKDILLQLEFHDDEPPRFFTTRRGLRFEPMRRHPALPLSPLLFIFTLCDCRARFAPPADKKDLRILVFVIRVGTGFDEHLQAVPEVVGLAWWQRSREAIEAEEIFWCEAKDHIAILEEIEMGFIRLEGDLPLILVARAACRLCDRRGAP
jgi:hypothetical protein